MVIQVVNFNLEGITYEEYMGAAKEVAPAFKELSGLRSKVWLSDEENNTEVSLEEVSVSENQEPEVNSDETDTSNS